MGARTVRVGTPLRDAAESDQDQGDDEHGQGDGPEADTPTAWPWL